MEGLLKAAKSVGHFDEPLDEYFAHIRGDFDVGGGLHGRGEIGVESEIFLILISDQNGTKSPLLPAT